MYFEGIEKNQTKLWIINSLLTLLERKDYATITINMIVDHAGLGRRTFYRHFKTKDEILHHCFKGCATQFSTYIAAHAPKDYREFCVVYFSFWNENMNMLTILNKSGIMYRFASEFESLVMMMSSQIGHDSKDKSAALKANPKYKYHFAYRTAGFWHVTELWSQEEPRKSPEEMADIMMEITSFPGGDRII